MTLIMRWGLVGVAVLSIISCTLGGPKQAVYPEHSERLAGVVCDLLVGCGGSQVDRDACVQLVTPDLLFIADEQRFVDCVKQQGCLLLQTELSDSLASCATLDAETFHCNDQNGLDFCDVHGACSSISCIDVCAASTAKFDGCGPVNGKTYDNCLCILAR